MNSLRNIALRRLTHIAPRYLPFADVATRQVPLSRLLRLSLFQVTVGMALVLMVGTLNRIMIVELEVSATLVACMLALPLLSAPLRAFIGFKSDSHKSALGLRRLPYIWKGTMYQFGGFAIMPFALLVLSGYAEAVDAPRWVGLASAALAFLLVGAGGHMVQTVGLALATDLVKEEDHPKVVGLMYVMLLFGMVLSAIIYGALLHVYTPGRMIQVIQGTAVMTIALNLLAMWKQEPRDRSRAEHMQRVPRVEFWASWSVLMSRPGLKNLLVVLGFGTFGFSMADVLLEPYGGQALGFSVAETTRLTAFLASGTFVGFSLAARLLGRGGDASLLSAIGAAIGVAGFICIILSSAFIGAVLFVFGTLLTGLGAGLFGHATLTSIIRSAPKDQIGLSLGMWGAVQATSAGIGFSLAGLGRDLLALDTFNLSLQVQTPYNVIFTIEVLFLLLAILASLQLATRRGNGLSIKPRPKTVEEQ